MIVPSPFYLEEFKIYRSDTVFLKSHIQAWWTWCLKPRQFDSAAHAVNQKAVLPTRTTSTEPPEKPCSPFWVEFISQNDVVAQSYLVCEDPGQWFNRCHLVNFLLETQNPTLTNSLWVKWEGFILWLWEGCVCEREKDEGERKSVNLIRNLGHGIGNKYLHSQWIV